MVIVRTIILDVKFKFYYFILLFSSTLCTNYCINTFFYFYNCTCNGYGHLRHFLHNYFHYFVYLIELNCCNVHSFITCSNKGIFKINFDTLHTFSKWVNTFLKILISLNGLYRMESIISVVLSFLYFWDIFSWIYLR